MSPDKQQFTVSTDRPSAPVLALDFGGTKLAAGIIDLAGPTLLSERYEPTPTVGGASASLARVLSMSWSMLRETGVARPAGVGVSFGGPVDVQSNVVLRSLHVPGWEQFPLGDALAEEFGAPVVVENDANAAALGEWRFGFHAPLTCLVYYTISTGIGGGIVLNGKVYRGASGVAGELGHVIIDRTGPICPCGNRGCLEALCSGPAIARRARTALNRYPWMSSSLAPREVPGDPLTAKSVALAAQAGDALARNVYQAVADDLAQGIASAVNVLNPDVVVIGGGVSQTADVLFVPLRNALPRYVFPQALARLSIRTTFFAERVGLFGAAALLR